MKSSEGNNTLPLTQHLHSTPHVVWISRPPEASIVIGSDEGCWPIYYSAEGVDFNFASNYFDPGGEKATTTASVSTKQEYSFIFLPPQEVVYYVGEVVRCA